MSDVVSGRNESTTGRSSDINFDDSYDYVNFPSDFKIQNVVTSLVSCSGYSSSSYALETSQLVDFVGANINNISSITLITGCTFQFMTGPVTIVNKPVLFK